MTKTPLSSLLLLALLAHAPTAQSAQSAAEEQYRFLAALAQKGLHEEAVPQARAFLRDHPEHARAPLARFTLAGALWELGKLDEAAREYEPLARDARFEYRSEALFRCGEAARARGDEARARAAFEGVLAAGQAYLVPPALLALGETHFSARRFAEAEQRYQELLSAHAESSEAPLARRALVWCAWERGDAPETVRRARQFLQVERDPARADELRLLCGEALLASDPRAALETFRALKTPAQAEARLRGEGFALAALEQHADAARAFEELLERNPQGPHAREALLQAGIAHLRAGATDTARARLKVAAREGEPETLYWLAQAEKQAGEPKAALATLDAALRKKPARELEGRIQVLRGDCLAADGRAEDALAAYESSGSGPALHAGAVAALAAGDAAGAARLAERLLRSEPGGPRAQAARIVLAEAHFAAQRWSEAEQGFQAALAEPTDAAEATRLASRAAWCRYLAGDLDTAHARFTTLCERAPRTAEGEEAAYMLVCIALARGDTAGGAREAAQYLQRFAQGRFAEPALLAVARAAEGRAARTHLEDWLRRFPQSPQRAGVLLELADRESAAHEPGPALGHYREVLELAPESSEAARASYGLAWCAWEQEDYAGCRRALAPLLEARTADAGLRAAALELQLWAEVAEQALPQALATWRALAALRGDERRSLQAAQRLLAALRAEERFDEAAALLEECARALPTRALQAELELERAYLALERDDLAGAEKALARARKGGAGEAALAEASFHLGEARYAAGDVERALPLFEGAAAPGNPRAADALYRLGFARLARGELAPASAALLALLEQHPRSTFEDEAHFLLGECAFRQERFDAAVEQLGLVRAKDGELRARTLFRLGLAQERRQRFAECEAALGELARVFPQFPNLAEAELVRGRALLAQQKGRPARAAFERTLALDQGELAAAARLGLGTLAEQEGRLDDALSEYLKVALLYAHEPSVAEALLAAGRVLEAQGQAGKAAARYRELLETQPRSAPAARARERLRALEGG